MLALDPAICLMGALLLLIVPLPWLAAAALAAIFHEFCHWGAIRLLGGQVFSLRVGSGGAVMHTHLQGRGREAAAALAGPLGSFALLLLRNGFPELALCGLVQGIYNLLPVYPLDGGRILRCLLEPLIPTHMQWVEEGLFWMLLVSTLLGGVMLRWGWLPMLGMLCLASRRKSPCKRNQIRVQ